jgi:hypothetical protein
MIWQSKYLAPRKKDMVFTRALAAPGIVHSAVFSDALAWRAPAVKTRAGAGLLDLERFSIGVCRRNAGRGRGHKVWHLAADRGARRRAFDHGHRGRCSL